MKTQGILVILFASSTAVGAKDFVLDLSQPAHEITLNEQGYWDKTYSTADEYKWLEFGIFKVGHILNSYGGTDVGGGMSYWDGFTYCTSGDNTDHGYSGSSDGWVPEQWGVMAGGGIQTDPLGQVLTDHSGNVMVEKGIPYLVGYWGYWPEEQIPGATNCTTIKFGDKNEMYHAKGIYVCNHPWPYYGNLHGDGFARPFTNPDDSFKLYVHGIDALGNPTGDVVEHILADMTVQGDGSCALNQSANWEWVDLSALGEVSGIYFSMSSSDTDPVLGMNTACYFCIDRLTVSDTAADPTPRPKRPTNIRFVDATDPDTQLAFTWDCETGPVEIDHFNIYRDGELRFTTSERNGMLFSLRPYTSYSVSIQAVGKNGMMSDRATISGRTDDTVPPTAPSDLYVDNISDNGLTLHWAASEDASVDPNGGDDIDANTILYDVYQDGVKIRRNTRATSYKVSGLDRGTTYRFSVVARDSKGNESEAGHIEAMIDPSGVDLMTVGNNATIRIFDLSGKEIPSASASGLAPGVYIVRTANGVNKKITK